MTRRVQNLCAAGRNQETVEQCAPGSGAATNRRSRIRTPTPLRQRGKRQRSTIPIPIPTPTRPRSYFQFSCVAPWRAAVVVAVQIEQGMKSARYIVVEGPIGAGKTTLARFLAEEFNCRSMLEQVDDNPFLRKFYEEPGFYAFQAQLFFLLSRYRQQQRLAQQDLLQQGTVADYLFAKDHIFAEVNLDGDELSLYRQLFKLLDARLPKPDLVVYLQARADVLMDRLRKRDRDYERHITAEYIERVAEAYRQYFYNYEETPLLVVESSEIDIVQSPDELAGLVREIQRMGRGVQHYIPLGSR